MFLVQQLSSSGTAQKGNSLAVSSAARPSRGHLKVNAYRATDLDRSDVEEIRSVVKSTLHAKPVRPAPTGNAVVDFMNKVNLAWSIFFPEEPKVISPKDDVKKRLRMVLVADRCGMNPASLNEMKNTIVKSLQTYVDISEEDAIEVNVSTEPEMGTVYSVNIPIRRVKPDARFDLKELKESQPLGNGMSMTWDPSDWNSDPSGQFPYGT